MSAAAVTPVASVEQVVITPEQITRAGIATAPALATLPDSGAISGDAIVLSGTVVAPTTSTVVSGAVWGGMVQEVHVATLQTVKVGAPLVTLFSQPWMELQREYVELSAQARLSADKLARDESLYADGIISRVRLEESRSAAHLARLAADQRAQALRAGDMNQAAIAKLPENRQLSPLQTVRAQTAGTVVELPLSVGQQVEPGSSVAKIVREGPLWVELQASRQQLTSVSVGDKLFVAENCQLKVSAISPLVNGVNQTALIRAEQVERNGCLKVNAFVEARLARPRTQAGALAVPATALVRRGTTSYVFVRNDKGFQAVPVQPGAAAGDQVWVRGGLRAGAPVAMRGLVAIKGAWSGLGEPAVEAKGQP
ncbi:HlyD family efflux transporter periplasmic adaptor subunit [Duganella sp. FT50W]|uniref:HlyD family efflux transporter periplasmic adaptor subunit n=2 Tax=Duganella lactea TaxID=2692173 RepID=A0A6L8MTU6_9BURK|nr:HlyD family efflux transporter periplasmic adaptor subunit [Duganella lactea]